MKATLRSGREGSARHNGRDFDTSTAQHIDQARAKDNIVQGYRLSAYASLEECEVAAYRQIFGAHIKETQERYHAKRQYEREKGYTAEKLYKGRKTSPRETILQVGSLKDGTIDKKTLMSCINGFYAKCRERIPHYAECVKHLSFALHMDEATPHAHIRECFACDGEPSQKKALERMEFERPDKTKPESRYNSALMSFTAKSRELWYEVIQEHGIEIDTDPLPTRTHQTRNDYVREQYADLQAKINRYDELNRDISRKAKILAKKEAEIAERDKPRVSPSLSIWCFRALYSGRSKSLLDFFSVMMSCSSAPSFLKASI